MSPAATRAALIAAAAAAGLGLGAALWLAVPHGDRFADCRDGGGVAGAAIGGPFALTRSDGVRVTDVEAFDRLTLLYFGYTHCPDFCPTDAATMAAAADLLEARGVAVNLIFATVDPARDTAAVVGEFAAAMHPRMVGLTGSDADVAAAAKAWRVYYAKQGDDPVHYLMDHSTFTYLVAPGGQLLDFFRHGADPEAMAERAACYAAALG